MKAIQYFVFGYIATVFCGLLRFSTAADESSTIVFTFDTNKGDRLNRFVSTANRLNYSVTVLESGRRWVTRGEDHSVCRGNDEKPVVLRKALEPFKHDSSQMILFVDSYDMLMLISPQELERIYRSFRAKVVFATESKCQSVSVEESSSGDTLDENSCLSSSGFIGYASYVYELLSEAIEIIGTDCDQMLYTRVFQHPLRRQTLGIKLDRNSKIFQTLPEADDLLTITFESETETKLFNTKMGTFPAVLLGSEQTKEKFNYLSNYVPNQWTMELGCLTCTDNEIRVPIGTNEDYPVVMLAIFITSPTPFMEEFFDRIEQLTYPKAHIDLFIYQPITRHDVDAERFLNVNANKYRSYQVLDSSRVSTELTARIMSFEQVQVKQCDYYLAVDGVAQLEHSSIIEKLVGRNRSVIAPLLTRPGKLWSNFWGAVSSIGYYERSEDYNDIVGYVKTGVWNVPLIRNAYLIKRHVASVLTDLKHYDVWDNDMIVCKELRDRGIFMFVDNTGYYGHLVDPSNYRSNRLHSDLYEIFDNKYTWEKKYINSGYFEALEKPLQAIDQPCPDVFWVPIVSEKFCRHLVEEVEHYGQWSGGRHEDSRLHGGYENVPTVDIHTNQIEWEQHWLQILKDYVKPLNAKLYEGYYSDSRAIMNFVVRYRPDEQDRLRPHNDASTFSINIALNNAGVDYTGGGTRFVRYNCSVTESRLGWTLMHPGRLTHYHEGLPVTSGTRYIMVSFIDP